MTAGELTGRLPRGRHKLSREEVAAAQRERLLRALGDAMAEKGYARTSVADVLRRARVSRETFYELFDSKEDCFMSAFEDANERLIAAVARARTGPRAESSTPLQRLEAVLGGYLEALAADPAYARIFLIEVYAAGPAAARRRIELQQRFVSAVAEDFGVDTPEDLFAIQASIAAVYALVTARLAVGDIDGLRALHAPLVSLISTLPFAR
jgi:AcrR family transcriptional regulator